MSSGRDPDKIGGTFEGQGVYSVGFTSNKSEHCSAGSDSTNAATFIPQPQATRQGEQFHHEQQSLGRQQQQQQQHCSQGSHSGRGDGALNRLIDTFMKQCSEDDEDNPDIQGHDHRGSVNDSVSVQQQQALHMGLNSIAVAVPHMNVVHAATATSSTSISAGILPMGGPARSHHQQQHSSVGVNGLDLGDSGARVNLSSTRQLPSYTSPPSDPLMMGAIGEGQQGTHSFAGMMVPRVSQHQYDAQLVDSRDSYQTTTSAESPSSQVPLGSLPLHSHPPAPQQSPLQQQEQQPTQATHKQTTSKNKKRSRRTSSSTKVRAPRRGDTIDRSSSLSDQEDKPQFQESDDFPKCLATEEHDQRLTSYQRIIRKQMEFFQAKDADLVGPFQGRNRKVVMYQVGIRCCHCAHHRPQERGRGSMYFPSNMLGIYQSAQNLAQYHLTSHCKLLPSAIREDIIRLKRVKAATKKGGKHYWAERSKEMGIREERGRLYVVAKHEVASKPTSQEGATASTNTSNANTGS